MSRVAWLRLALMAGLIALLEFFCRIGAIDHRVVIPPSEMFLALISLLLSGAVTRDIIRTFGAVAIAFVLAVISGFAIGLAIHALPRLRRALDPFLATYYAIPLFVFYPVLISLFGISMLPIVIMGYAFAVVTVIISTLTGLDHVPRVLRKVARVHRLSRMATVARLIMPSAAPHLFTGMKLAVAYCFIGVIASEFIAASSGIGHGIAYAYSDFNNRTMYALMLLILIVVTAVNMLLHHYEQRLSRRMTKSFKG
jgi:NitT/TauT family transport system permease protein